MRQYTKSSPIKGVVTLLVPKYRHIEPNYAYKKNTESNYVKFVMYIIYVACKHVWEETRYSPTDLL